MCSNYLDHRYPEFLQRLEVEALLISQPMKNTVIINGKQLETTPVFGAYWKFACERQTIFLEKLFGKKQQEHNPILTNYRFTNVYRASDRVSQFLIKEVIGPAENTSFENIFFRTILFKIFNKIETWKYLEGSVGKITIDSFEVGLYQEILATAMLRGKAIYSAAYIMPSPKFGQQKKHHNHLLLIEYMLKKDIPKSIEGANSLESIFEILRSIPSLGDFLAFQFTIDLNYSGALGFDENDFVVAGPGALDGIAKCFIDTKGVKPADVIFFMTEHQEKYFNLYGLNFENLWGRPLHKIDCQNIFCEVSKYARVAHPEIKGISARSRIKQIYKPSSAYPDKPFYPPHWGINQNVDASWDDRNPSASASQLSLL